MTILLSAIGLRIVSIVLLWVAIRRFSLATYDGDDYKTDIAADDFRLPGVGALAGTATIDVDGVQREVALDSTKNGYVLVFKHNLVPVSVE